MRRALRILSVALITAGLVVLADVATTLAWKEPVSTVYGSIQQGKAEDELAELKSRFPARADLREVEHVEGIRKKVEILAGLFAKRVAQGRGDRPAPDPEHRPRRGRRRGHGHRQPPEGPGPLSRNAVPGPGRHVGDSPDTAPPTWPRFAISTS